VDYLSENPQFHPRLTISKNNSGREQPDK